MGSFVGHVIPGSFFCLFAFWQTIQIFRCYYESLRKSGSPFVNRVTHKINCGRFGQIDIDSKVIVISAALGVIIETIISPLFHGTALGVNNSQHGTMYFFFGLTGLMNLLLPRLKIFPYHEGIIYCLLSLSFAVEGILFKFHLYGRDSIDVMVHTLLLYTVYACVLSTLCELRYRHNVLASLVRSFFTMLQGTWFWHVAFLLYPPSDDPWGTEHGGHDHGGENHMQMSPTPSSINTSSNEHTVLHHTKRSMGADHEEMMIIAMAFTWHMAIILILMMVIGGLIGCIYQRRGDLDQGKILLQELNPSDKGYTVLSVDQEEEEAE